jgi:nucleotide-binding universal stress UspA family protein
MARCEKILVAVDEGETSLMALRYVGRIAASMKDVLICLLHVYPEPPPDFSINGGVLDTYQADRRKRAERIFAQGISVLHQAGIHPDQINKAIHMAEGRTISETVLTIQREGEFGTVVVGKRGVSKAEEFLFGSISNALARNSRNFTTWIVG